MAGLDGINTQAQVQVQANLNPASATGGAGSVNGAQTAFTEALGKSTAVRADQANVSAAGGLVAQVSATSDVRTERVAQLQAAIAAGSYHVSPDEVAGKLIEHLLS